MADRDQLLRTRVEMLGVLAGIPGKPPAEDILKAVNRALILSIAARQDVCRQYEQMKKKEG